MEKLGDLWKGLSMIKKFWIISLAIWPIFIIVYERELSFKSLLLAFCVDLIFSLGYVFRWIEGKWEIWKLEGIVNE